MSTAHATVPEPVACERCGHPVPVGIADPQCETCGGSGMYPQTNEQTGDLAEAPCECVTEGRCRDCSHGLWVNAYVVTRHYGGPEEGGWWYDAGEPLASVPVRSRDLALVEQGRLESLLADHAHGNIGSVLGGAEVRVHIEHRFAQAWPAQRPHYE